jgi:hypothetical protein
MWKSEDFPFVIFPVFIFSLNWLSIYSGETEVAGPNRKGDRER